MGGFGNACRGGRLPPLFIAALLAGIIVLGFNYWVSSAHILEQQRTLYKMEGTVRRVALDRDAMELKKNKFQEDLRKKSNEINRMETAHKSQLDAMLAKWKQEKAILELNISISSRAIQRMKVQFHSLFASLGEMQKELQGCEANRTKLSSDTTQCKAQLVVLKKGCAQEEVVAKLGKIPPVNAAPDSNNGLGKGGAAKPSRDDTKKLSVLASKTDLEAAQQDDPSAKLPMLESNEIARDGDAPPSLTGKDLAKLEHGVPVATRKMVILQQEGGKGQPGGGARQQEELEDLDTHGGLLQAKVAGKGQNPGDDYNRGEQNVGASKVEKQAQLAGKEQDVGWVEQDLLDDIADYNGDEENVGEFEEDKQAVLAKI